MDARFQAESFLPSILIMVAWPRLVAVEKKLKCNLIVSKCNKGGVCSRACPVGSTFIAQTYPLFY